MLHSVYLYYIVKSAAIIDYFATCLGAVLRFVVLLV